MIAEPLARALEGAGYLANGECAAPSVTLSRSDADIRLPSFDPDAWWRSGATTEHHGISTGGLTVYFKYVKDPERVPIAEWQREIWNQGFAPLLWLVSPERIDLYNGFGTPLQRDDFKANRLDTFGLVDAELTRLDAVAGRLAMETGDFWRRVPGISRKTSVDRKLLRDLNSLERALVDTGLGHDGAQGLIGRCIFTKYLIDRPIVTEQQLIAECGHGDLSEVLEDRTATERLFAWLRDTFNGDMFPASTEVVPDAQHLDRMARFLRGEDPKTGQLHFFPYRFDVIPVELVSAIYEQFVHSSASASTGAHRVRNEGVYYTPLAAVSLVLDEVFGGLTGKESVLDLTCGSGVFLVEALRRLVHLSTADRKPSRATIRKILYDQVYGVDISESALRIAAFSLYLAALELDPEPRPPEALRFQPLRGRTLLVGDARTIEQTAAGREVLRQEESLKQFDVIVGNPPWSHTGKTGTVARRTAGSRAPLRGQSLDFVARAMDFAHGKTRFGMILSATPFFGKSGSSTGAVRDIVDALTPVTLINLSDLSSWLFPKADMPAVALLARHHGQHACRMTLVQARWSPAGEQSHTIEIAPSDVTTLPIASWRRNAALLKAAFLGCRPDLLLLDELWEKHEPLEARLAALGTHLRAGLIFGNRSSDATFLRDLPFVHKRSVRPFRLFDDLHEFDQDSAQWPRRRDIYRAPLLLVSKFMQGAPRPVAAVTSRDALFTTRTTARRFAERHPMQLTL